MTNTITWGTPESATGLVTLAEVKNALGIEGTTDDTLLNDHIAEAVATIGKRWTLPTVPKATTTRTKWCDGGSLWTDELVSVTALVDLSDVALLYVTEPVDGFIERLILREPITGSLKVTGTWGYDTVPADVKRGIIVTVGSWYMRDKHGEESAYRGIRHAIPQEAVDIFEARRARRL